MDDARVARAFAKTVNRRMVVLGGTAMGTLGQREARAFQLGPATCREEGAVCTLVSGCCDALTCATSAINTSYGICVPGEGGMVSIGTTLISPFSETAVDDVEALVQTASTAPATDPKADRQDHLAEVRDRKDAAHTDQLTRLDTKRADARARKDQKQLEQQTSHDEKKAAHGPRVMFELTNPGGE